MELTTIILKNIVTKSDLNCERFSIGSPLLETFFEQCILCSSLFTMRLPSKGPNSPFSVGTRTLLARTCRQCGKLADGESFPRISGTNARRSVCHDCFNARKKRDREERGIGLPNTRPPEEQQTNKRQRWTEQEDLYLTENLPDKSYEEIAVVLGRSLRAVYKRREVLGITAVRKQHRVEEPWRIANP